MNESDFQLVVQLRSGDRKAQRTLFRQYYDGPFRRARQVLQSESDAHDVTAGLLADFMERLVHQFRGGSEASLRTYLATAAVSRAIRVRQRRHKMEPVEERVDDSRSGPRDTLLLRRLEDCLNHLPASARRVLALKYGNDWNNAEIARLLGISRAAVSQQLVDKRKGALARLRRCIGGGNEHRHE